MFFTFANQKVENPVIRINDLGIANVDYFKQLGLYTDQNLEWIIHTDQLAGKLDRLAGICYRLRNKLHPKLVLRPSILPFSILIYCLV